MPIREYTKSKTMIPGCAPAKCEHYYSNSRNSPRVNGKLQLQQQNYRYVHDRLLNLWHSNNACIGEALGPNRNVRLPPGVGWASLENRALARFNGKLRKGSASMGVTLAGWKQSQEMIVHRTKYLGHQADYAVRALSRDKGRLHYLRRKKDPVANEVLELEFGWQPLFEDLHAALFTVIADATPPSYLKSRHREYVKRTYRSSGPYNGYTETWEGFMHVTLSSQVRVVNPNLWLLNRMGLINPATVIWDLVPWSFVVNMFVNVNQMISCVTDTVGLSITDKSTTRNSRFLVEHDAYNKLVKTTQGSTLYLKEKTRVVGSLPTPSWEVKVPEVSWETAIIAASLALQKVQRLNRLIRL